LTLIAFAALVFIDNGISAHENIVTFHPKGQRILIPPFGRFESSRPSIRSAKPPIRTISLPWRKPSLRKFPAQFPARFEVGMFAADPGDEIQNSRRLAVLRRRAAQTQDRGCPGRRYERFKLLGGMCRSVPQVRGKRFWSMSDRRQH